MKIIKKDGTAQGFMPNKILTRIKKQAKGLKVNADELFRDVIPSIEDGMTTTEIDQLIGFKAEDKKIIHPDYSLLGGKILLSRQAKLLGKKMEEVDKTYDFFAATTFLKKYSKKVNGVPTELPSCMYKRVASNLAKDEDEYNLFYKELTAKRMNFASPIYTNCGVEGRGGNISCNLTHLREDSLEGIEDTLIKMAKASKEGAGIGLLVDPLRSKLTDVSSLGAKAAGVVRFADMVQGKMRFYKQGNRSGMCAMYLSLWHRDILDFLGLTLPIGDEKLRARDLFTAVIINDLFMKTLSKDGVWYLFCPEDLRKAELKPFQNLWGEEFEKEYQKAVELNLGTPVRAKDIWDNIIKSQGESGKPYVMFKDNANKRNMQRNIGVIKQSNLCIEIFQASKPEYTPQCTLGSINLAAHDDVDTIKTSVKAMVRALNRVIDVNKWSDDWSKNAGLDQRALAIGVAGLADFFAKKKISFESEAAKEWNHKIFEAMYKAAVEESNCMAVEENRVYPSWGDSPYSKGETYIEGWTPLEKGKPIKMLNSLLIGLMPTATSAIVLGVYESFEPVTSNLFTRRVGQGEFIIVNKYLVGELDELELWDDEMRNAIIKNEGSVLGIDRIPQDIQYRYKTVWEIPQKVLLDLAAIRNKYVDQSQSLNVYHKQAKYTKISSALFYAWKIGLKTGVYYTRTKDVRGQNTKLSTGLGEQEISQKPKDNQFECFGCSA